METYTQENEINEVENALQREAAIKDIFEAVDHEELEDEPEDVNEDDDEEIPDGTDIIDEFYD